MRSPITYLSKLLTSRRETRAIRIWSSIISLLALVLAIGLSGRPALATSSPAGTWDTGVAPVPVSGNYWTATTAPDSTGARQLIYVPQFFFDVYDPSTNSWACAVGDPSPGCASRTLSPMPDPRWGSGAVTAPDKTGKKSLVNVVGGYNYVSKSQSALNAYDPGTNTWSTLTSMPTRRDQFAATTAPDASGTKTLIYVVGGITDGGPAMSTVEAYDPTTDTWTCSTGDASPGCSSFTLKPLPMPANGLVAVTVGNLIYAAGAQASLLAYDPAANTWTAKAPMPHDSWWPAAAVGPDHRIYIVGGSQTLQAEAYDPSTDTWDTSLPRMPNGGGALAAATGPDGRIYVMAGYNTTFQNYVEAYSIAKPAGGAAVSLLPTSGTYRTTVHIQGSGFANGEQIKIYWDNTNGTPLTTATAAGNGSLSTLTQVPAATQFGHAVIAVGVKSGSVATTSFQVLPSGVLARSQAVAGSPDSVTVYGVEAFDHINLMMDLVPVSMLSPATRRAKQQLAPPPYPPATKRQPLTATVFSGGFANGQGVTTLPFHVPALAQATYTLQPCGWFSGCAPAMLLQVRPTLNILPQSGGHNVSVIIKGAGFAANDPIMIIWNCAVLYCAGGTVLGASPYPVTSDANGAFSARIVIPASAVVGRTYIIKAVGTWRDSAQAQYKVTS